MKPTISIITVTYNCEQTVRMTIESVLNQTYPHIEYIIVDGASKDKTMDIVREYAGRITRIVSEPDNGLYDAMNKGQQLASGDFIWFLNAGDTLHEKDTVEKLMNYYDPGTDVLYGEVMLVTPDRRPIGMRSEVTTQKTPKRLNWRSLRRGMVVSHQAFIPRRSLAQPYIPNNLAADIDWVINILKKARKTTYVPLILADFETGGTSRLNHRRSLRDRFDILRKHYGTIPNLWNHLWITLRALGYKMTGRSKY